MFDGEAYHSAMMRWWALGAFLHSSPGWYRLVPWAGEDSDGLTVGRPVLEAAATCELTDRGVFGDLEFLRAVAGAAAVVALRSGEGAMKVPEVIRVIEIDGWRQDRMKGSHRVFLHP